MRLFVAFPLPRALVDEVAVAMEGGPPRLRWIPEDDLHCTVRFIGEVDPHTAASISERLAAIPLEPIAAHVDGVGVFDHQRRGALWARLGPREPLRALHAKLDRMIVQCGLPPERRAYLPHVTLARWSGRSVDPRPWCERFAGLSGADHTLGQLVLFESRLLPSGPQYEPLDVKPLAG